MGVQRDLYLLSPWIEPYSPDGLAAELQREVGPGHPLFGKSARALAVARDRDDVLFEINDGSNVQYAVVHLTWQKESNPLWPGTEFFSSLESWIEWMKADHDDYTYGDESEHGV
jgi:hypothetical protein